MKFPLAALILAACALTMGTAAKADTLLTGALSPDTARLICNRVGANFFISDADGYGCHNIRLMISCRAGLDCISRVRDLNSHEGNTLAAYMRRHGMRAVDSTSQPFPD